MWVQQWISEWMPPIEEFVEGCDGIELLQAKVQTSNVEGRRVLVLVGCVLMMIGEVVLTVIQMMWWS